MAWRLQVTWCAGLEVPRTGPLTCSSNRSPPLAAQYAKSRGVTDGGLFSRETELGLRCARIVDALRARRPWFPVATVVETGTMGETELYASLVEDRGAGAESYGEYLCQVHGQVQSGGD